MKTVIEEITGRLSLKNFDCGGQGIPVITQWCITKDGPHTPPGQAADSDGNPAFDHPLKNGDALTVFRDAAGDITLWEGPVNLDPEKDEIPYRVTSEIGVSWINTLQVEQGFPARDEKEWAKMFVQNMRAKLVSVTRS